MPNTKVHANVIVNDIARESNNDRIVLLPKATNLERKTLGITTITDGSSTRK